MLRQSFYSPSSSSATRTESGATFDNTRNPTTNPNYFGGTPSHYSFRPSPPAASSTAYSPGQFYYESPQQSAGFRKSGSYEPMNTSPTLQQQHSHHGQSSPTRSRRLSSSPVHTGYYLPAYFTGAGESSPAFHHHNSPPLIRTRSLKELNAPNASSVGGAGDGRGQGKGKENELTPAKKGPSTPGAVTSRGPPIFGLGSSSAELSPTPSTSLIRSDSKLYDPRSGQGDGSIESYLVAIGAGGTQSLAAEDEENQQQQQSLFESYQAHTSASAPPILTTPPLSTTSTKTKPPSPIVTSLWVTVYGFSVSSTSYVISHFSQFGTVTDMKTIPGANWIQLKFSNKFEVIKALNKNGTIICGNMMIGVMPYEEDSSLVVGSGTGNRKSGGGPVSGMEEADVQILDRDRGTASSNSTTGANRRGIDPALVQDVKSRLRPLARAGYIGTNPLPKESTGIVAKVFDYVFGW